MKFEEGGRNLMSDISLARITPRLERQVETPRHSDHDHAHSVQGGHSFSDPVPGL